MSVDVALLRSLDAIQQVIDMDNGWNLWERNRLMLVEHVEMSVDVALEDPTPILSDSYN